MRYIAKQTCSNELDGTSKCMDEGFDISNSPFHHATVQVKTSFQLPVFYLEILKLNLRKTKDKGWKKRTIFLLMIGDIGKQIFLETF